MLERYHFSSVCATADGAEEIYGRDEEVRSDALVEASINFYRLLARA